MRLHGPDEPVYTIGVVARLLRISPQTLRQFEREGLVAPSRTDNNMRLYSQNELVILRRICKLVKEEGVNLAGVRAVLRIERHYGIYVDQSQATGGRKTPGDGAEAAVETTTDPARPVGAGTRRGSGGRRADGDDRDEAGAGRARSGPRHPGGGDWLLLLAMIAAVLPR